MTFCANALVKPGTTSSSSSVALLRLVRTRMVVPAEPFANGTLICSPSLRRPARLGRRVMSASTDRPPAEAMARARERKPCLLTVSRAIGWFRGKDSNLRSRIQSPLPYLLATPERLPGYQWWPGDELRCPASPKRVCGTLWPARDVTSGGWGALGLSDESAASVAVGGVDRGLRGLPLPGPEPVWNWHRGRPRDGGPVLASRGGESAAVRPPAGRRPGAR